LQDNSGTYKTISRTKSLPKIMDPSLVATILLPSGKPTGHGDMTRKLCKPLKFPVMWFEALVSIIYDTCLPVIRVAQGPSR